MQQFLSRLFSTTGGRIGVGAVLAVIITSIAVLSTGGGGGDTETATEPTPTAEPTVEPTAEPTATPEPTPTPEPETLSPLNGLPVRGQVPTRRVLGVKIDNAAEARPQSGIEAADVVVEIWVEGITRFLSLWQRADTDYVGPIRSMRPTDFHILNSMEATFVNSGGQGFVQAIGNASNVEYFQEPAGSFRVSGRFAPHNLYGDTEALRELDTRGARYDEALEPLWNFDEMPTDAVDVTTITTNWPQGYVVSWEWNGEAWDRFTLGAPHEWITQDGATREQVTTDTLVMLEMELQTAGGGSGTPVPESVTTGSGTAWVFADGKVHEGTWAREADTEWFTLTTADGEEMAVPPGRQWLILPPPGGVVFE
jgi:hypothetical protein